MKQLFSFTLFVFLFLLQHGSYSQVVLLDSTFSNDGKANNSIGLYDDYVSGGTLQPDGKIIVAGIAYDDILQYTMPVLLRYNSDGTLDNSFYGSGKHQYDLQLAGHEYTNRPVVLSNGKILLPISKPAGFNGFMLMRLNSDGTPDSTFGTNAVAINQSQKNTGEVFCAVQQDGKIILAGECNNDFPATGDGFFVARFNADGSVDSTFNGNGYMTDILNSSSSTYARDVELDNGGNIFVIGTSTQNIKNVGTVMCVTSSGLLNNTFDSDGIVYYEHNQEYTTFDNAVFTSSGRLLVVGATYYSAQDVYKGLVVLMDIDGFVTSFNTTGKKEFSAESITVLHAAAVDSSGKFVVGGYTGPDILNRKLLVSRLNQDGSFDNSFTGSGHFTHPWGSIASCEDLCIQPDGKIVGIVSVAGVNNNYYELAAVRLLQGSSNPTGLANDVLSELNVLPNPFTEKLQIHYHEPFTYCLISSNGQEMMSGTSIDSDLSLDTQQLYTGIYVLKVQSMKGTAYHKLIKQ